MIALCVCVIVWMCVNVSVLEGEREEEKYCVHNKTIKKIHKAYNWYFLIISAIMLVLILLCICLHKRSLGEREKKIERCRRKDLFPSFQDSINSLMLRSQCSCCELMLAELDSPPHDSSPSPQFLARAPRGAFESWCTAARCVTNSRTRYKCQKKTLSPAVAFHRTR